MNYIKTILVYGVPVVILAGTVYCCFNKGVNMYKNYKINKMCNKKNIAVKDAEMFNNKYIKIDYVYLNQPYTVRLPYYMTEISTQVNVYAKYADDKLLDITQQPGIHYYVKCDDLDAQSIVSYDYDTNEEKVLEINDK
ncbi:MAG TPA: hypothetical protein VLG50_05605 [Candidatus Saccharimonadales bacterium]|nr:hypothetical protein [Candidatus Saccharimonadales bacterium]